MSLIWWLVRLLPVLGAALGVFGILAPLPDAWWDPQGFIVNIVSSLTAACFGIPLAVVVLQSLLRHEERIRSQSETVGVLESSLDHIRRDVTALLGDRRAADIGPSLNSLMAQYSRLERFSPPLKQAQFTRIGLEDIEEIVSAISEAAHIASDLVSQNPIEQETRWGAARIRWRILRDDLLPRSSNAGFEPLTLSQQHKLDVFLTSSQNPVHDLSVLARADADRQSEHMRLFFEDSDGGGPTRDTADVPWHLIQFEMKKILRATTELIAYFEFEELVAEALLSLEAPTSPGSS